MYYRSDSIAVSRDMGPLSRCLCAAPPPPPDLVIPLPNQGGESKGGEGIAATCIYILRISPTSAGIMKGIYLGGHQPYTTATKLLEAQGLGVVFSAGDVRAAQKSQESSNMQSQWQFSACLLWGVPRLWVRLLWLLGPKTTLSDTHFIPRLHTTHPHVEA